MAKLPKILKKRDIKKMFSVIDTNTQTGLRNSVCIHLMYRGGLRNSEVRNLHLDDVDIEQGLIYVQQGKNHKDRYIPMDDVTVNICKRWLKVHPDCEYFVCTIDARQLSERYLRELSYRISRKAKVYINDNHKKKPVNPHVFRHTYATELLKEGYNIREVQELLGHSSIQTTMIYTHIDMDELAAKIKKRR